MGGSAYMLAAAFFLTKKLWCFFIASFSLLTKVRTSASVRHRMRLFKRKKVIHYQIEEFAYERREFVTTNEYKRWLHYFVKVTGIQNAADITEYDINSFLDAVKDIRGSEFTRIQAQTALRIFLSFIRQHDMIEGMPKRKNSPGQGRKFENYEMAKKIKFLYDQGGLSFPEISRVVERDISYVHRLYKRFLGDEKLSPKKAIAKFANKV